VRGRTAVRPALRFLALAAGKGTHTNRAVRVYQQGILLRTLHTGEPPARGRKLTVDEKHTSEALHAHYKQERNLHIAKRLQALRLPWVRFSRHNPNILGVVQATRTAITYDLTGLFDW